MTFRIGLAQCRHPEDGNVAALVERFAAKARAEGVDVLVFPECLMTPFERTREDFLASAQPLGGAFSQSMAHVAAKFGLWIVYTMNEAGCTSAEGKKAHPAALPFNTAVIVDSRGMTRGVYRKTHLYDAFDVRESDRMAKGDALFRPVAAPLGTIGLGICYDLRFPEVARAAALSGCDLMVYPAAWVDGEGKAEQWRTLLAARAIENEMFVAGLCRADDRYIGCSMVVDPLGKTLACAHGREESLVTADIDPDRIRAVRTAMPVFDHRRPELYGQNSR